MQAERLAFSSHAPFKRDKLTHNTTATISNVRGKYFFILSKENWVLSKEKKLPKGVFEIKIKDAQCKVGSEADLINAKNVDILNELIEELEKNKIKIDYIDVTNKLTLEVGVDGRFVVNYGNPNYLPQKTKHLKEMVKSIEKGASGRINLNMWTSQNTQGTFVKDME